jgi:TolB protein
MNADGSNERRLTRSTAYDDGPAWSPDGKRIVFSSDRHERPDIYAMNADGSAIKQLTRNTDEAGVDISPSWSPDGKRIIFVRRSAPGTSADFEIDVANSDGTGIRPLTTNHAGDCCPDWYTPTPH